MTMETPICWADPLAAMQDGPPPCVAPHSGRGVEREAPVFKGCEEVVRFKAGWGLSWYHHGHFRHRFIGGTYHIIPYIRPV